MSKISPVPGGFAACGRLPSRSPSESTGRRWTGAISRIGQVGMDGEAGRICMTEALMRPLGFQGG